MATARQIELSVLGADRSFSSSAPGDAAIIGVLLQARDHGALSAGEYSAAIHELGVSRSDREAFAAIVKQNGRLLISTS